MSFDRIRIVLVETSHPGNIGSSARAMKNMGFSSLYLVQPKQFPHPQANELAAGSEDVLEQAVVVSDLKEALVGCQLVFMMSARTRTIGLPQITPREAAEASFTADGQTVAYVFGREYAGLTNEELLLGQYHVVIDANPQYSSLNLSQAVQIITYELRMSQLLLQAKPKQIERVDAFASHESIELFYSHLTEVFIQIGFLKLAAPRRLIQRFRRLFGRTRLEKMEIDLLRGMLSRVQYCLSSKKNDDVTS